MIDSRPRSVAAARGGRDANDALISRVRACARARGWRGRLVRPTRLARLRASRLADAEEWRGVGASPI
jgi:hypothetical protein